MLHVPFSLISKDQLDSETLKEIRKHYFVNEKLCEVLKDRRIAHPGELLRIEGLLNYANPVEVYKLVVPPFYDQPDYSVGSNIISSEELPIGKTNIKVHLWMLKDNFYRISFSSIDGELFSIGLNDEFEIDPTTIKVGGHWFWELPKLPVGVRKILFSRLIRPQYIKEFEELGKMNKEAQPVHGKKKLPLRKVAQAMTFIYSITGGYRLSSGLNDRAVAPVSTGTLNETIYEPGQPMDHDDYPQSNYCTLSPDWPFGECCVAHDFCYVETEKARGCDECARFKCDLDFLKCMLGVAGVNPALQQMAFVYFIAVRAFGEFAFDYCDKSVASSVVIGSITLGTSLGVVAGVAGGEIVGAAVGVAATAGTLIINGFLLCGMCEIVEVMVEKCEADRKVREERCRRKKKKCKKKKKWWKKLWCKVKYFFVCKVIEYIIRGACWLVKQGYRLVC